MSGDEEIKEQIKAIKDDLINIQKEFVRQITEIKTSINSQGAKIDNFLSIMTENAVLSEKHSALEKQLSSCNALNVKDHDELFKRLRAVEIEITPQQKDNKTQTISVVWDVVKIMIGVFIALFISGKVKIP